MLCVSRLIEKFIPTNYNLSIKIDRKDRRFFGHVKIMGTITGDQDAISLHCKNLNIQSARINSTKASYVLNKDDELLLESSGIKPGTNEITIEFDGIISDQMHGMYPCYFNHDGKKKEWIATQFESHHAREVFPCIDEPEAKATFDLTLETEANITVLGNMPIKQQVEKNDRLTTTFHTTPKMSTYLLAWVAGEMQKKSASSKHGVEVNVWSTPSQPIDSLDFALDIACRVTDFFDDYFDIPYPLPKCDHVALPDFSSGAMENWGLITYREILLLYDRKTTSITTRNHIAMVIAHELSHQWFGNLVTMKWWNDLWLNESFATMIEYLAIDTIEPDWNVWMDFACNETTSALRRDSIAGVQPIKATVNHPDEIMALFDGAIMYAKGARLIRMMQKYIGEDAFRDSLRLYFKKHAYGNTEASDLWESLSETSDSNISSIMEKWISQPGYPLVTIKQSGDNFEFTQKRLSSNQDKSSEETWPIPLNASCDRFPKLFSEKSIRVENCKLNGPLIMNKSSYSHYITNYDEILFSNLLEKIGSKELSEIDRLQLVNEQSILARTGNISNGKLIPLILAMQNENSEPVWDSISSSFCDLKKFVEDDNKSEKTLKKLAAKIASKQFDRLGWDELSNEQETDSKLRQTIIGLMTYSERQDIIDKAIEKFYSESLEKQNPQLRSIIISNAVKQDRDGKLVKDLINISKSSKSPEIKNDICVGLTSTKNVETINRLLGLLKDTEIIKTQDVFRWIVYMLRNKFSRDKTWHWICENWQWIEDNFEGDKSYDGFPRYASGALSTRKQLDEYIEFFTPLKSKPALSRVIEMGINEISDRVNLIERDSQAVKEALENFN